MVVGGSPIKVGQELKFSNDRKRASKSSSGAAHAAAGHLEDFRRIRQIDRVPSSRGRFSRAPLNRLRTASLTDTACVLSQRQRGS
jgi:hypothetical protein